MQVSATDKELLRYFIQLDEIQKKSLLELIKSFLSNDERYQNTSIEQYNKELDKAMKQIYENKLISIEELETEINSW